MLRRLITFGVHRTDFRKPGVIALIAANIFPVFGVLLLGWDVFPLLLLYWTESVTVGFFNVLKMAAASPGEKGAAISKFFIIPFFCVHYGIFTIAHGAIIFAFFSEAHDFPDWASITAVVSDNHLFWGILAILLSHGISFVVNYIKKGEYRESTLPGLMIQPYGRVVILHIAIIVGAVPAALLGSPAALLLVLVVLKTIIDIIAHLRQRRKYQHEREITG